MSVSVSDPPEPGQLVNVRSRRWVVNEVNKSALPVPAAQADVDNRPSISSPCSPSKTTLLAKSSRSSGRLSLGPRSSRKSHCPKPTGFDAPDRLDAFLDAVRWGAVILGGCPQNIQSPFRSGIDIEDYQLDPVVRAIQMPRVNLLVADDVGLGKTIESGSSLWN